MTLKFNILCVLAAATVLIGTVGCGGSTDQPNDDDNKDNNSTGVKYTQRYNTDLKIMSRVLGEEVKFDVLLPEEYINGTSEKYNVVYLLHGYGDSKTAWMGTTLNIRTLADAAVNSGDAIPMIFVMPQGYNTYYCDKYDGSYSYATMFVDELVPAVDKMFRVYGTASSRAVVGYSMGGFGALALASHNPGLFGVCIGLSPSLNSDEQYETLSQDGWDKQWGSIFGGKGTSGSARLTSYYKEMCPIHYFSGEGRKTSGKVKYMIDCGDDEERLYVGNGVLHNVMCDYSVAHEYRVSDGAHTSAYWSRAMKNEGLKFLTASFNGLTYETEPAQDNATMTTTALSESIDCDGLTLTVMKPASYDASKSYKVVYFGHGKGACSLSATDVACALESVMSSKRMLIVGFDTKDASDKNVSLSRIIDVVDSKYPLDNALTDRTGLLYGCDNGIFASAVSTSDQALRRLFVEDSDFKYDGSKMSADLFYMDITDGGTNRVAMFESFCAMRSAGTTVQYRVRNGADTKVSALNGIYSFVSTLGAPFNKN